MQPPHVTNRTVRRIVLSISAALLVLGGLAALRYATTQARVEHTVVDGQIRQARTRLKHVVFVLLENRSFDTMFGRFPGADGATTAVVAGSGKVPLLHSPSFSWHDIDHDEPNAITAI